jgi:NADH dehydrogenase
MPTMSITNKTRVLIVGGGFGGVKAALELSKAEVCEVTLLSDHDSFRYYPGLYHTATGGQKAGTHIALHDILNEQKVQLVQGKATQLDREKKEIITEGGQRLPYDTLILGLGSMTNYFGIKGLDEYSYGIKTIEDIDRFKRHLHEQLAQTGAPDDNYVIVGGGPTGIELAGALPGYLQGVMKRHGIKPTKLNIQLVEAMPTLLPRSPKKVQQSVQRRLEHMGITVMLGTAVGGQTADTLMAGQTPLKTTTVVWTAGVANNPFFKENGFTMTDHGKVQVDEHLQAEPGIYVIGDNAATQFGGMAQTALLDGEYVARNIHRALAGKQPLPYHPKKPITVIPVGPRWAAVEWGSMTFGGMIGGIIHYFVDLIGFHDIQESWGKASSQWMRSKEESDAEICPDCAKQQ